MPNRIEGKRIREEFGFESEIEAVREYHSLNRDLMYFNYPLIAEEAISRLNFKKGTILDIGAGLGALTVEFARRLPDSKIYGIDISEEMLGEAERLARKENIGNVEFMRCDAQNMVFRDASFDLIVSFGVLHHLKDLKQAFTELKRVLKKGGAAYIYDLKKDAPPDIVSETASGMNPAQRKAFLESVNEAFDPAHLEGILSSLGFSDYSLSCPKYSRRTIIKNKDILRKSRLLGDRFNKMLIEIFWRK